MEKSPFETIRGLRFSLWRGDPEGLGLSNPRWPTILGTGFATLLLFQGSAFLVGHPQIMGMWLFYALMALLYIPTVVVLVLMRRSRPKAVRLPRSTEIPTTATRARVSRMGGGSALGSSQGWIWIDGSWVRFRGDHFDFDLQRRDVRGNKPPSCREGRIALRLELPKGFPDGLLMIRAYGVDGSGSLRLDPAGGRALARSMAVWWSSPPRNEPAVFPPVTYDLARPALLPVALGWLPLGGSVAIAWLLSVPMFPRDTLPPRVVWGVPPMTIFMGLVVVLGVAGNNLTAWSHDRRLERLRRGRV